MTEAGTGCCSACASVTPERRWRAWLVKESVLDVYLADNPADAAVLFDKAITGCLADEVPEIITLGAAPGSPARTP